MNTQYHLGMDTLSPTIWLSACAHQLQQPLPILPEGSFFAQLAKHGARMFPDEEFAALYDERMRRPSVPPHLLCLLLLLQWYSGTSDQETIARSAYDLRWQAVLGLPPGMNLPGLG